MKDLVIIGGGFAGLWAAMAATRTIEDAGSDVRVTVISRDAYLTLRPRLYEAFPTNMREPLQPTLDAIGARLVIGEVDDIDTDKKVVSGPGLNGKVAYDRLIVATGSELSPLPIPGLADHGFDIDSYHSAVSLDEHLATLAQANKPGGETIVILGSGFTGLELATEMRERLRAHGGGAFSENARILLVERADEVAPDLGDNPRPVIEVALKEAGVETLLSRSIEKVEAGKVFLSDRTCISSSTVIATAGLQANSTVSLLDGEYDQTGRMTVEDTLRSPQHRSVFVTGDAARAKVDDNHYALMSCQHAMTMGKYAGYNAASDLIGKDVIPYRQPDYVTCLDLGSGGALLTQGWDREVQMTGAEAKALKRQINSLYIYPPKGSKADILAVALDGVDLPHVKTIQEFA